MLGLVMALATLYVALEFNTSSGNMSGDASQFDDMQDLDLMPALDRSDMIAAAPSGAPAKPTPKNVKVVDEVKKQLERNATINTLRDAQGEGEGGANGEQASDDEETTKALSPVAVDKDENPLKLRVVQLLPEFPGGMVEMMKWITRTLHYPYAAQKQKIEVLRQALRRFSAEFIDRRLRLDYTPTGLTVLTDEKWLCFVLEQLLSNALKYTREGSITVELAGERVLAIRDTGIGIAPEDLPRIFEKGYTGQNGRADNMLMVGDTKFDVIGAAAHGIPTIGVAWGYGETADMEAAGAKAIAQTPEHLVELLREM